MSDIAKRCGCRDEDGKQYGARCPQLGKRGHGRYSFRVSAGVDPKTNKRRWVTQGGFTSFDEAKDAKLEAERRLRAGSFKFDKQTVGVYITKWLDRASATGDIKPSTEQMNGRYVEADIVPALGHLQLRDLRKFHVSAFIDDLADAGRGATTTARSTRPFGARSATPWSAT